MANLTFNSIRIAGSKEAMQPILDILLPIMEWDKKKPSEKEGSDFINISLFESLVVLPEGLEWRTFYGTGANPTKKPNGYNYDITNYEENGNDVVLDLAVETAWVPCDGFCLQLSNKYGVSVTNDWDGDEIGIYQAVNGEVIQDQWWSDRAEGIYKLNPNDFDHFIECEVISRFDDDDLDGYTLQEFLDEYKFITKEEHIKELTEMFNEHYNSVNS